MQVKQSTLYLTKIGIIFASFAIGVAILEMSLHPNEAFFINNAYILGLMSPVLAFFASRRLVYVKKQTDLGPGTINFRFFKIRIPASFKITISMILTTVLILIVNIIFSLGKAKYQVIAVEIYLFYVAIGIGEEFYYRVLLVNATILAFQSRRKSISFVILAGIIVVTSLNALVRDIGIRLALLIIGSSFFVVQSFLEKGNSNRKTLIGDVAGIIVSAAMFSLAHYQVYALTFPEMMIATAITGAIMAFFYVWTRDPSVPAAAHAINNFFAAPHLINCTLLYLI